ncbi:hypothetical protein E4T38_08685 [Aureobasidium subglaciale]|nr:hypothetical protein E4T38_08685 [Aureobasidium subglaciale]KAI5214914.1 hypothetical protein E4T40_08698 [Aureobasidium subglaciale]KAI5218141.1 hypothetical protein E4T41_08552 [Aureobasidium subglaciale]KAI5255870.1 hypothetical protein E4T46_08597 [Aureobasidium subglaciale]
MPAAEGIVLILESQFDADTIPEAAIAGSDAMDSASYEQRSVDVYVPSYLASQFWISYTINPAMLAPTHAPTKYVFFKLMLDGESIVSWGVGEAEEWKGKTMWAFFRGEDQGGWRAVDKRAFFFRPTGHDQDFDILAFRARGRRRECRQFDDMPPMGEKGEKGFDLVNWGRLKEHNPQNFYQYALLDPVDQPYATFRYHVRGGPHHIDHPDTIGPYVSTVEQPSKPRDTLPDASQIRRLSYPPTICLTPTSSQAEPSSPTKLDSEHPVDSELDMSTILDPEPSATGQLLSASETTNNTEAQTEVAEQSEKERISSVDTVVRKRSLRTPTPLPLLINNTPPSSLRKRSGAKIKEWFGSISKRRAIRPRSTSPIHPSLSHKTSSASLS